MGVLLRKRAASVLGASWLILASVTFGASTSAAVETGSGQARAMVECTYAELHEGSCVASTLDQVVAITDALDTNTDGCAAGASGGGAEYRVCHFDGAGWSEFGASSTEMSVVMAGDAGELVLEILNPPPGSGLTPPVGDGIDGEPNAPRTDDAPAINAAIQYACDHGYDIAYLGAGTYRIGADLPASFYSGVRIDASQCPGGIKFYGAGAGRTLLLANGAAGQYIIFTTDYFVDTTKVLRLGWNTSGHVGDLQVTGITTEVTPPVVTASGDGRLRDGDTVLIRNCSGVAQANEQRFRLNACSETAPFSCELQDEFGVDINGDSWDPWTDESPCIVHKVNTEFATEIAYMTVRDDDPFEHMNVICNPLCQVPGEESHGIGILQSGGRVEVHDIVIDKIGDEGIDISAPESPTYVHDVTVLNAAFGGTPVYQGVGVRIEDVWVHKDEPSPWIDNQFGSTVYPPYSAGDAFSVVVGPHNWRVEDLHVNRLIATGELGLGFGIFSTSTGKSGQYVSGVKVTNSIVNLIPNQLHCNGQFETCGSFRIQVNDDGFPIEAVEISDNVMTGTAYLALANGDGGVIVKNNVITPIPTITPKWGMLAAAIETTIEDNVIEDFERGCIQYQPYPTNDGDNVSVSTTIQRNVLRCLSNATNRDAMIGPTGGSGGAPPDEEQGYLRILDNSFVAGGSGFIRNAVKITDSYNDVEICRNQVSFDPAADIQGRIGIWSESEDQLICDNSILLKGSGIQAVADRSKIVGNVVNGFNDDFATGITVSDSSEALVLNNVVKNYRHFSSTGIRAKAESEEQSKIWIIGNDVGPSGVGIDVDGNGMGLDDVSISGNLVEMDSFTPATGVLLHDTTGARVTGNDLTGLGGNLTNGLLTTGSTDFIVVRDNLAEGGGTLKFGTTGGDASCDPSGGVGDNSTCSDNDIQ